VRAVRRESSRAIRYWWGVSMDTVRCWRKALGVPRVNDGSRQLWKANARTPAAEAARRLAWGKARDPVRCAKIAAAKRGKPRPRHVIEAMRRGRLGLRHSEESKAKMRAGHRARRARAEG
jgi:hypothetical protein